MSGQRGIATVLYRRFAPGLHRHPHAMLAEHGHDEGIRRLVEDGTRELIDLGVDPATIEHEVVDDLFDGPASVLFVAGLADVIVRRAHAKRRPDDREPTLLRCDWTKCQNQVQPDDVTANGWRSELAVLPVVTLDGTEMHAVVLDVCARHADRLRTLMGQSL